MAENKKGFVLYADQISLFEALTDHEAGLLIKYIFKYVTDQNPIPSENRIVEMAFIPIKLQLKRDLKIWESKVKQRSEAGKASALSRSTKSTSVESRSTKSTVIDNVTVNVTDTVNVKVKDKVTNKDIDVRKENFAHTLTPFLQTYGKDFLNDFYKYWVEPNKSNTKFRMELEKTWDLSRRLETWAKNDKKFNTKNETSKVQKILNNSEALNNLYADTNDK
jgi:hypothetical protein